MNPRSFGVEDDGYFRGAYLSTIEENGKLKSDVESIYKKIVEDLSTCLIPNRLLDVGCAMGHFMVYARAAGWQPRGVECSSFAAAYGRKNFALEIESVCDLRDARLPVNHFDACVLIEVAEHLPYPKQTFEEVFKLLKPGGVLYVTTPNWGSFRSILRREEWSAIIPTGHLFYFNPGSMCAMLTSIGFTDFIDLTSPSDLASEIELARESGTLRLNDRELDELILRIEREDSGLLSNSGGEGLGFWARKPEVPDGVNAVMTRAFRRRSDLEGRLVTSAEDRKVYLIHGRRKRWVTSVDWLQKQGLSLSDVVQVADAELKSIVEGPPFQN